MAEESPLSDDLEAFAARLSGLPLPTTRVNRDQLMYDAGRAAAIQSLAGHRTSNRFWKIAAVISPLCAACLTAILMPRIQAPPVSRLTEPQIVRVAPQADVNVVSVNLESRQQETPKLFLNERAMPYITQRNLALQRGVDVLPVSQSSGTSRFGSGESGKDLLKSLIDSPEVGG